MNALGLHHWQIRDRTLSTAERPLIMGILNVTPDSFSDGGRFFSVADAVARGLQLLEEGADIVDVGGESTRPGAEPVSLDEELRRVLPVIEGLIRRTNDQAILSIDTHKPETTRRALEAGVRIVNDVTALRPGFDSTVDAVCKQKLALLHEHRPGVILMHSNGPPATMQQNPRYNNVVEDVLDFLGTRCAVLTENGIDAVTLAIDPGIGFGMTRDHTLALLRNLPRFTEIGRPLCLGVSRKGFLGQMLNRPREARAVGSVATACFAMAHGAAQILRVHDVAETRDAVIVFQTLGESAAHVTQ